MKHQIITEKDVNKPFYRFGKLTFNVSSFIGRILPMDVGKRVYLVGDTLQVENDKQRKKRELINLLDKTQQKENKGRGISSVQTLVLLFRVEEFQMANDIYYNTCCDETKNYPEIQSLISEIFPLV